MLYSWRIIGFDAMKPFMFVYACVNVCVTLHKLELFWKILLSCVVQDPVSQTFSQYCMVGFFLQYCWQWWMLRVCNLCLFKIYRFISCYLFSLYSYASDFQLNSFSLCTCKYMFCYEFQCSLLQFLEILVSLTLQNNELLQVLMNQNANIKFA